MPIPSPHKPIHDFLADKQEALRAFVSDAGEVFYEETKNDQAADLLNLLLLVVRRHHENPEIFSLNPIEYERLVTDDAAAPAPSDSVRESTKSRAGRIADTIISESIAKRASDFFIDIRDEVGYVAYKVHGRLLHSNIEVPGEVAREVIRALWSLGERDWNESEPCDVSFTATSAKGDIFRIRGNSLFEETRGHGVAFRLRNPKEIIPLGKAGYLDSQLLALERMAGAPGGLFVIAGPTDSGKSTTLTAMVDSMSRALRKIEIADPPEIFLDHCVHVTIKRSVDGSYEGLNQVLGATVRQNPDVLVLAEIRDKLSAAAAMGMCQQGKRVLSTLHANNCSGVVPRLRDLGVELSLLAFREFFTGCASQNLVAILCSNCRREVDKGNKNETRLWESFGDRVRFVGDGCVECEGRGTTGQTLVAEVYPLIDDAGRAYELIAEKNWSALARHMAEEHGVQGKHAAAAKLVESGKSDPVDIERRIGRFPARPGKEAA